MPKKDEARICTSSPNPLDILVMFQDLRYQQNQSLMTLIVPGSLHPNAPILQHLVPFFPGLCQQSIVLPTII